MTMTERLYEVGKDLPPTALAELLDFAEFLRQKNCRGGVATGMLATLKGGLEESTTFAGSPLAIQEHLRNEWD